MKYRKKPGCEDRHRRSTWHGYSFDRELGIPRGTLPFGANEGPGLSSQSLFYEQPRHCSRGLSPEKRPHSRHNRRMMGSPRHRRLRRQFSAHLGIPSPEQACVLDSSGTASLRSLSSSHAQRDLCTAPGLSFDDRDDSSQLPSQFEKRPFRTLTEGGSVRT